MKNCPELQMCHGTEKPLWKLSEFKDVSFYKSVFAELLATLFFTYAITSVLISMTSPTSLASISWSIGITLTILLQIFGPISGGHINPAVTIAMLVKQDITVIKAVAYIFAQHVGAILGACITYGVTPAKRRGNLGIVEKASDVTISQAFFIEMILTMILVSTIMSTCHLRRDLNQSGKNFMIGLSVVAAHFVGVPCSGSCINPARAFGPYVVANKWPTYCWIYWVAPIVGGIIVSIIFQFPFSTSKERTLSQAKIVPKKNTTKGI